MVIIGIGGNNMPDKKTHNLEKQDNKPYVVGVGASAGGLEAIQDFFKMMPDHPGVAFVVIQHLSPDYKSLMNELLSRYTKMPIDIAEDGTIVERDHVYLIPPKKELSIQNGTLRLIEQNNVNGINLAIDAFFKSLAEDCGNRAIAVVLSGAGSDGSLGIRFVKESGGMIMVQEPQTAAFNSMPVNAISTGLVDFVLPPKDMANAMIRFIEHPLSNRKEELSFMHDLDENMLSKVLSVLNNYCHMDFTKYKENTLIRRLERRISINQFDSLEEYYEFLSQSNQEKETLFKELLIGVTGFFRDSDAFDFLSKNVIPYLKPVDNQIRIWSVACSTGEEVYSLAMLLNEYMDKSHQHFEVKIFATDIDKDAINKASLGYYPSSIVSSVDEYLLNKYFTECEDGYRINQNIRKMIIFSAHNVLSDPPFSRLHMIVCRNLFIYLKSYIQQELLCRFYYALNSGGYLFMGSSESVGEMNESFGVVSRKWKIYQQKDGVQPSFAPTSKANGILSQYSDIARSSLTRVADNHIIKMEKIIEQAFSAMSPPSIIINESDNIIYMENDINRILSFKPGVFSQNLFSNLPNGLGLFVNGLLRRLRSGEKTFTSISANDLPEFKGQTITITGYVLNVSKNRFYLLTFEVAKLDTVKEITIVDGKQQIDERINELEEELRISKENLQATVEELETTNEELQSSNEELVAANEELQSTNEELQSVNEELYTVNSEYQSKIDELTRLNMDLDNLLINVEVGALYLDNNLQIRKVTPVVSKITNIMEMDIGRPISHIALMDSYPNWQEDVKKVQKTLIPIDKEIYDPNGRYWLVRIRPYRTEYHSVEGVIVTFLEATDLRMMRNSSFELSGRLYWQRENCDILIWRYDLDKKMLYENYSSSEESVGKKVEIASFTSMIHKDDIVHVESAIHECMSGAKNSCELMFRCLIDKDTIYQWVYIQMLVVQKHSDGTASILQGKRTILDN